MSFQSAEKKHDLGVIIDNKLKVHSHCQNQVSKANKVHGLIKLSVTCHQPRLIKKLYTGLVCPHLEFDMMVANLHFKCDMEILEKVQHRAKKPSISKKQISYEQWLKKLDHPTLIYYRNRGDAILAFKMMTSDTIKPIFIMVNTPKHKETPENCIKNFEESVRS